MNEETGNIKSKWNQINNLKYIEDKHLNIKQSPWQFFFSKHYQELTSYNNTDYSQKHDHKNARCTNLINR